MSYILDALKRADAERERGAVPGLHARPWPNEASAAPAGVSTRRWVLVAVAMALGSIALGLWLWRTPAPAPQLPPAPEPLAAAPTAMLAPAPVPAQALRPAPAPEKPEPLSPAAKVALAAPQAAASKTNALTQPDAATPPANKTPTPSAATAPVPLLSELPEAVRGQVPALTITGTVYSDNPALRLLLVNNQVLPQGSMVAAGVTLEEIRPRSSVFSVRGTRFRLAH